jgi:hypothetical protein
VTVALVSVAFVALRLVKNAESAERSVLKREVVVAEPIKAEVAVRVVA